MQPFTILRGPAAPLLHDNINTDILMPSHWGRDHPDRLGEGLLRDWRFDAAGAERPDFILNDPRYRAVRILVAGRNFGCGSSRETAVWGLAGYGIRAVIAPSFGEIFRDNAFQNGILAIDQPEATVQALALRLAETPVLTIDLLRCVIEQEGAAPLAFAIADDRRSALLEGLDETLLLRRFEADTAAFQRRDRLRRPWVY
jgi:3-isopropylmalate/(R)-2-methylmalate dehydratase small subunit